MRISNPLGVLVTCLPHMLKMFHIHVWISLELVLCMNSVVTELFTYNPYNFLCMLSFIVFQCNPPFFPCVFPSCSLECFLSWLGQGHFWGVEPLYKARLSETVWKSYQLAKERERCPWIGQDLKFEVTSDWFLPCISQLSPTAEEKKWHNHLQSWALKLLIMWHWWFVLG